MKKETRQKRTAGKHLLIAAVGLFLCLLFAPTTHVQASASDLVNLEVDALHRYGKGQGINVAVIDRGFDISDPFLASRLKGCYNASINSEKKRDIDYQPHGTGCVQKLLSVAPKVNLYIIQMSPDGEQFDWNSLERAIDWAIKKRCRIISMSMYIHTTNMEYISKKESSFLKAYHHNITVFCSAGNTGKIEMHYPATFDSTISVCAALANSKGKYTALEQNTRNDKNDISAPGTVTSHATPFAAGVGALLLQAKPSLTPKAMKNVLISTALDINTKGKDKRSGYGLIQPRKAFQKVKPGALKTVYSVSFQAGSGTARTLKKSVEKNKAYGKLPSASRAGYQFLGWYTKKIGGEKVTANTKVTVLKNHTLYAHWRAKTYKLSFRPNGGKVSAASMKVTMGASYGKLPVPVRAGYQFQGWYTKKEGGKRIVSGSKVKTAKNQTLYAHWKKK